MYLEKIFSMVIAGGAVRSGLLQVYTRLSTEKQGKSKGERPVSGVVTVGGKVVGMGSGMYEAVPAGASDANPYSTTS